MADLAAHAILAAGGRVVVTDEDMYRDRLIGMGLRITQEYDQIRRQYVFTVQRESDVVDGDVVGPRELPATVPALPVGCS